VTRQLESEFTARLQDAIGQSRALGYPPNRFEQMLAEHGAYALARKLVKSGELQDGLKAMAKLNRMDLTMESIMLEAKFRPLFTSQELSAAKWRLDQVGV